MSPFVRCRRLSMQPHVLYLTPACLASLNAVQRASPVLQLALCGLQVHCRRRTWAVAVVANRVLGCWCHSIQSHVPHLIPALPYTPHLGCGLLLVTSSLLWGASATLRALPGLWLVTLCGVQVPLHAVQGHPEQVIGGGSILGNLAAKNDEHVVNLQNKHIVPKEGVNGQRARAHTHTQAHTHTCMNRRMI
eukprot:scaffold36998_cov21-Tisochrysis_lutea.AAC.1